MRILVAGFQHETNTFAPSKAGYDNFVRGEYFPPLLRGADVLSLRGVNIPAGGFIRRMERLGHALAPVIWAGACPSAHVTQDAFERIVGEITAAARSGAFDAVYLDLHGAMVTEHLDDGEGEILARVRAAVGPSVPVVASLDLHANVTERMLRHADGLVAFRTYPHVDMAETGERTATFLLDLMASGRRPAMLHRRLPFLIPINAMCTLLEPAASVYRRLAQAEEAGVSLSFAPGFPAADFPGCGPVVWGYGRDQAALARAVDAVHDDIAGREGEWTVSFLSPEAAVGEAMGLARRAARPVVIADTQDNPTAGTDSNTTGMLRALVNGGAQRAAIGLLYDPAAARAAHEAGAGADVTIALGGTSGIPGDRPFEATFRVESLSDGRCRLEGPMLTGSELALGPSACLSVGGVKVAVTSTKTPMIDRALFRMVGVEPEAMAVLVVKSSVHFRADFEPMAEAILVATAPGPFIADPGLLPWRNLAPGIRTRPLGRAFAKADQRAAGTARLPLAEGAGD